MDDDADRDIIPLSTCFANCLARINVSEMLKVLCSKLADMAAILILLKEHLLPKEEMNQYNQAPQLTQDTYEKVTLQSDITNEIQVSPFPAGDHKESINRCA